MDKIKVLFVAANPDKQLNIDKEFAEINQVLSKTSTHRTSFEILKPVLAASTEDVLLELNQEPDIIHFSTLANENGIELVNQMNEKQTMRWKSLFRLLEQHKTNIKLVVLNTDVSDSHIIEISNLGFYTIGASGMFDNNASLRFAKGLYLGLGEGKSLKKSFDDGLIMLESEATEAQVEFWYKGEKCDKWKDNPDLFNVLTSNNNMLCSNYHNPFSNRSTLKTEHEFVGRSREIANIVSRLRNAQSVSVVGERRMGKSSLLYHLFLTGKQRMGENSRFKFRFVYLDMTNPQMKTPFSFVKKVLDTLEIKYNANELKESPATEFTDCLEKNSELGSMPILLMDEFEAITKHKELFTDDFIDGLRSLCCAGWLCIVTSSKLTLKEITDNGNLTSGFWNIFTKVDLTEFVCDNRINETALFLTHYWKGDLIPTEKEKTFLCAFASRQPLKLQIISYWVFENRKFDYSHHELLQKIVNEFDSFFKVVPKNLLPDLLHKLPLPDKQIEWTTKGIENQLVYCV